MKKLTIGIIGAGRIGQLHAANALRSDKIVLKTIADMYTDHLSETNIPSNVPVITQNPDDIFNDSEIDAVFICSSTDSHVDFIKKAAHAKKHIFCEKPISMSMDESKEALEVVKATGIKYQIGFNRRFDKHFKAAYEAVRNNKIGTPHIIKITSRDPEAPPESYIQKSGGMFMDMTIHDFDMIRYLANQEVKDITVKATSLIDEKFTRNDDVDTAVITITFADGTLGVIDNSRQAVYGYDQRIEIFGNEGLITVENEKATNVTVSSKEMVTTDKPKYFFLERYNDAFIAEIDSFVEAVLEDKPVLATIDDGLQAQLLAVAAKISWKENRTVEVASLLTEQQV